MFPALLPLTYIPQLLQRTKQLFLSLFQPYLEALIDALSDRAAAVSKSGRTALQILGGKIIDEQWERIFDRCLKSCEDSGPRRSTRASAAQRQLSLVSPDSGSDSESNAGWAVELC